MKELIGTGVALITPFKEDLTIDFEGLQRVVNYTIANGVDYLVVLGLAFQLGQGGSGRLC